MYALHPDGARVVMAPPSETDAAAASHLTLVLNLFDELRRSTPARTVRCVGHRAAYSRS